MAVLDDQNRAALEAVTAFTTDAMVSIVDGEVDGNTIRAPNGTGLILKISSGSVFLLTAAHVLEDTAPGISWTLGHKSNFGLAGAVKGYVRHEGADVALVELHQSAQDELRPYALSAEIVAQQKDASFAEGDTPFVCGCPTDRRTVQTDHRSRVVSYKFPVCCALTIWRGTCADKGYERHKVEWGGYMVESGIELGHPGGISGGPLFRFRKPLRDEVWSPWKGLNVVGVASTYSKPIEYCPSVSAWGDWFQTVTAIFPSTST